MAGFRFDTAELEILADDLAYAGDRGADVAYDVTERAASDLEDLAKSFVRSQIRGKYLPHYPDSIDHDTWFGGSGVTAEVGPNIGKVQGAFGPGVELGSSNTSPRPHMIPAAEIITPRWQDELAQRAAELLL